jgi:pSer/pThr/pTyr-binding forkhead associated (FHA) protein
MGKNVTVSKHTEKPTKPGSYHRLVCLTGELKGTAYLIISNRIVLGRSEKADIRVMDIKSSREHAEITTIGSRLIVTDLASQNGVTVNDLKIKQHKLKHGDKIIIGKTAYKYEHFTIEAQENADEEVEENDDDESFEEGEDEPKKKKPLILFVVVGGIMLLLFTGGDEEVGNRKKKQTKNYKMSEVSDDFANVVQKKKQLEDKKLKEKLDVIFQRGLREYREKNYFRALSEFDLALMLSPKDQLANYYKRKTKEALDNEIKSLFDKGRRDYESLKYESAVVAYCSIIRLLHNYPEDERYQDAEANLRAVEELLGMDENEIKCIKE